MNFNDRFIPALRVGTRTKIKYSDGQGGVQVTEGKLLDDDDKGYVVVEEDDGQQRYIPKKNIVDILM